MACVVVISVASVIICHKCQASESMRLSYYFEYYRHFNPKQVDLYQPLLQKVSRNQI